MQKSFQTACLAVICTLMLMGCSQRFSNHDLDGTWVGTDHVSNSRGISTTNKTLSLSVDQHGLISGTTKWTLLTGPGGNKKDAPTIEDIEKVIGAFDADSGKVYLVETEENGFWQGELTSPDTMHIFLVQTGEKPVISFMVLNRTGD